MSILERRNLLFITLLLSITVATQTLPLILIDFVSEWTAIITSVIAVFIFSEVIPQTVCTGPNQLKIGATLAPIMKLLIFLESPVAYPISKILDYILAAHMKARYQNDDLKNLIVLLCQSNNDDESPAEQEEHDPSTLKTRLIKGALDLRATTAKSVMKAYDDVVGINVKEVLTEAYIKRLREQGYSRYPVYKENKHHVLGIFLVKKLIGLTMFDQTLEQLKMPLRRPLVVPPTKPLIELLSEFRGGNSHIAVVTEQVAELQKYFKGRVLPVFGS